MSARVVFLAALLACANALAQPFPSRPIHIVVPFPPGGGTDVVARAVAPAMSEALGQPVIIDNRSGAGGNIGTEAVARSAPDGYTLLVASAATAINNTLAKNISWQVAKDFAPVVLLVINQNVLVAHPSVPASSVKELIALARANPGKVSYASPGSGNSSHLAGELFNSMANVKILHIPYKGMAPAVVSVVSGEGNILYSSIPPILGHVRSGRVRALGVGNDKRVPSLPEFPTISESGLPGYEAYAWAGMIGPAGMPRDIVMRLNKEIVATLNQKDVVDRMLSEGTVPTPSSPEEFTAYLKAELKKWGAVVKLAGIKPE
jgi:tripartite-type tricarboxylate transporter receptor subunit TctC